MWKLDLFSYFFSLLVQILIKDRIWIILVSTRYFTSIATFPLKLSCLEILFEIKWMTDTWNVVGLVLLLLFYFYSFSLPIHEQAMGVCVQKLIFLFSPAKTWQQNSALGMSLVFFFALGVNVENVIRKGKNVVMSERRKKNWFRISNHDL